MNIVPMQVTLIDSMGTDLTCVNAARVSFDKESTWELDFSKDHKFGDTVLSEKDAKLIRYLATNNHFTPFTHCTATFRIKVPIFVARQLHKHQVGFTVNEVSRRYVDSEPEFFFPDVWRKKAENVKQGSSEEPITPTFIKGICVHCGVPFTPKNHRQKFCCPEHQMQHHRDLNPMKYKWSGWKASAKASGREFSITEEDLDFPIYCPYLGIRLSYEINTGLVDNTASLDRIDSTKDYIPGNVQIISLKANRLKNDSNKEELIKFAKSVLEIHGGYVLPEKSGVEQVYETSLIAYNSLIAQGVCAEQARMVLPQGVFTEFYMTGSLYGWARMCNLRLDSHAQKEIRDIASLLSSEMSQLFPVSWRNLVSV